MKITIKNCQVGNKAMAWILLLYYHIINEGGITCDQTVYIDINEFDPYQFLDLKVVENNLEIDEELIKEGTTIFFICEINDMVSQYDYNDDYKKLDYYLKIKKLFEDGKFSIIPETNKLFKLLDINKNGDKLSEYYIILKIIYEKYIFKRIKNLVQ